MNKHWKIVALTVAALFATDLTAQEQGRTKAEERPRAERRERAERAPQAPIGAPLREQIRQRVQMLRERMLEQRDRPADENRPGRAPRGEGGERQGSRAGKGARMLERMSPAQLLRLQRAIKWQLAERGRFFAQQGLGAQHRMGPGAGLHGRGLLAPRLRAHLFHQQGQRAQGSRAGGLRGLLQRGETFRGQGLRAGGLGQRRGDLRGKGDPEPRRRHPRAGAGETAV